MAVILAGIMLPTEALVLPQFMEFRALHLLGTYWALVLPAIAAPVAVFVFHSFLKQVPEELIDARLDGAGWWRIYLQVCMPLFAVFLLLHRRIVQGVAQTGIK